MGGKGRRRREKNYKAAHGGGVRLPPPPDPSSVDAVPSKLRKIMSFAGAAKQPDSRLKKNTGSGDDKGALPGGVSDSVVTGAKRKRSDPSLPSHTEHSDEVPEMSNPEKKKKKRNNKNVDDLRFEEVGQPGASGSRRKERKKQRLEERKKKRKRAKTEDDVDFHDRELIKFGDVVQAPPKLTAIPKASKTIQNASQERLRLQAIEAYRKRKGGASRPGVQLPPPMTTTSLLHRN